MENPSKIGFGDDSLFVLSQKFQEKTPIIYELDIHTMTFQGQEYWFIANYPQAGFVFLTNGQSLDFIRKAPNLILDHLSVIFQQMVLEYSFRNQSVEKVRAQLSVQIRAMENWLNGIMIGRRDKMAFQMNKEKTRHEIRLNLITHNDIPEIIGLSTDFHLPEEIYTALYDEMFVLSLPKKV